MGAEKGNKVVDPNTVAHNYIGARAIFRSKLTQHKILTKEKKHFQNHEP